jgi:hypothetical protein
VLKTRPIKVGFVRYVRKKKKKKKSVPPPKRVSFDWTKEEGGKKNFPQSIANCTVHSAGWNIPRSKVLFL